MANSVETRFPYLDYRLIEFMSRVPEKWKIRGLKEKYILKKVMEKILPPTIVHRPKHPFRAPISPGLAGKSVRERISEKDIVDAGLFDWQEVSLLLGKLVSNPSVSEIDDMALTGILSAQYIYSRFIRNFQAAGEQHKTTVTAVFDKRSRIRAFSP